MNTLTLYCDGLVEPTNPGGWGCWAWLAIGPQGTRLKQAGGCIGRGPDVTNNQVEYTAVLNALRYTTSRIALLRERGLQVLLRTDSQLVVRQVEGAWACRSPRLLPLRDQVRQCAEALRQGGVPVVCEWVPREQNTDADTLSRLIYAAVLRSPGHYALVGAP
jgi:ribonuclease HI